MWARNDPEPRDFAFRQKVDYVRTLADHPDETVREGATGALARITRSGTS